MTKKVSVELTAVERAIEGAAIRFFQEVIRRATSVEALGDELRTGFRPSVLRSVFTNVVLGDDEGLVGFTLRKPLDTVFKTAAVSGPSTSTRSEPLASTVVNILRRVGLRNRVAAFRLVPCSL
jgi:hypothetical protein